MNAIVNLKHVSADYTVSTEGKTKAAILAEIKAAGYKLGDKSLASLLSGEKAQAGDFMIAGVTVDPINPDAAAATSGSDLVPHDQVKAEDTPRDTANPYPFPKGQGATEATPAPAAGPVVLTPEQQALADKVEAEMPTRDSEKPTLRGTNWKGVLPETPIAVKKGSKVHQLLGALCRPDGVTKKQLMDEFGWSAGGLSGILHWEPKAKGYLLTSEKVNGELRYHLCFHLSYKGGSEPTRVQEHEIALHEGGATAPKSDLAAKIKDLKKARGIPVPEAAPKAQKAATTEGTEPKVTAAAAANADKAPKVTKEQRAAAAPMAAANVTSRRRSKPAQA